MKNELMAVALALAVTAHAETVKVVEDFEQAKGEGWEQVPDAAVGRGAGATEQVSKSWDGLSLRVKGVPQEADGISFWVRTAEGRTAALTLGLFEWDDKQQVEAFGAHLWAAPSWHRHVVPFASMQRVWARAGNEKLEKEKVGTVQFQRLLYAGGLSSTRVVFDQVEFVKGAVQPSVEAKEPSSRIVVEAGRPAAKLKRFWRALSPADTVEQNTRFEGPDGEAMRVIGADRTFDFARIAWHTAPKANPWVRYTYGAPIYALDAAGKPVYRFDGQDALIANVVKCGLKPMILLHGMPAPLASDPKALIYGGSISPPSDYAQWGALVGEFVRHYVSLYGEKEVAQWYWEIWNEPDLWWFSWKLKEKDAGFDAYTKLYDYTSAAIAQALPKARLGGPTIAGFPRDYAARLLRHAVEGKNAATGGTGAPLSFLSYHCYDGAFGQMVKLYEAKDALAKLGKLGEVEVQITEYGDAIWGRRFATRYQAAALCHAIAAFAHAARTDNARIDGLYWFGLLRAFSPDCDAYFVEPNPKARMQATTLFLHVRNTLLAKPVYNAYRMLNSLDTAWLEVAGAHFGEPVHAIATLADDRSRLSVLVYNHDASSRETGGAARPVELTVRGLPFGGPVVVREFRIDPTHSDVFAAWEALASPAVSQITPAQVQKIKEHDGLEPGAPVRTQDLAKGGTWTTSLSLPPHSLALFVLTPKAP